MTERSLPVTRDLPRGSAVLLLNVAKPAFFWSDTMMRVIVPAAGAFFAWARRAAQAGLLYCLYSHVLLLQHTRLRSIRATALYCRACNALDSAELHSTVLSTVVAILPLMPVA